MDVDERQLIWNLLFFLNFCSASYHEQYRVPYTVDNKWESYVTGDTEYIVQNSQVNWEEATILCRGQHNGTLAIVDTREKAEFLAEALSESQFDLSEVWVGAKRQSAEDPAGYSWGPGLELRRTALDVLPSEKDGNMGRHFPIWLNRTHVPVPESGADCVALERVNHDQPVFLDLPCQLDRAFVCQREVQQVTAVAEVKVVRCKEGVYRLYDGKMSWHQAAAYCVLRTMSLANIGTSKCLKKLGTTMLKNRPSIENAWIGATGKLGDWTWMDTGYSIFQTMFTDMKQEPWPPMRDRYNIKQNGCLQLDRHATHPPVFMEARCDRKMQFICYQASNALTMKTQSAPPNDDLYYYILVKQRFYWQHAYENCLKMNGSLASLDSNDIMIQLLLVMGENKEQPVEHIWTSGRLNISKDITSDSINYAWYNPKNGNRIPDPRSSGDFTFGFYMPPWLDEEFTMDNSCLNLDRHDHLAGVVYGLPCDTPQYSVCMIEKSSKVIPPVSMEPAQPMPEAD